MCFRIHRGVRQGCIMSLWLFNVYVDAVMKDVKIGVGKMGEIERFMEEGRKWRLSATLVCR